MILAPPVGVVVVNHNHRDFVDRAIASVARQTVRNLQVAVVDDASTDGSDVTIRECLGRLDDPRFSFIRLDSNVGQTAALARGLASLDTPFVAVLDSDDAWYETFVARHLEVQLNADFPVALTYSDSHVVDADDRLLVGTAWWFDAGRPGHWSTRDMDPGLLPTLDPSTGTLAWPVRSGTTFHPQWSRDGATNTMSSMMFRRAFIDMVLVPQCAELRLYADFYLSTFACLMTGAIAIHQPLYAYRMHGANRHSNATVPGGAYNSSTHDWKTIRDGVLRLVQSVLRHEASALRAAFGDERYAEAERLLANVIGRAPRGGPAGYRPPAARSRLLGNLLGDGLARLGLRSRA